MVKLSSFQKLAILSRSALCATDWIALLALSIEFFVWILSDNFVLLRYCP